LIPAHRPARADSGFGIRAVSDGAAFFVARPFACPFALAWTLLPLDCPSRVAGMGDSPLAGALGFVLIGMVRERLRSSRVPVLRTRGGSETFRVSVRWRSSRTACALRENARNGT